ncbi:hypothetical protein P4H61_05910 [Paenibacillus peoriae]|uniref:hypothetical protein n=1 Tax=Paenibacillus peoriae TaxID=59893 RepID=UPI00026C568D|nr:hypothetical protein [Paenibacillus peoriae]MEC0181029.1 hypothetical protein [Paenibacillus peoriae]
MGRIDEQWLKMIAEQEQKEKQKSARSALSGENISSSIQEGELVIGDERIHFESKEVVPDRVYMFVPASFVPLPDDYAKMKYPADRRPQTIFADETLEINLTVNATNNRLVNDEMESFVKDLSTMLKRMQPNARWIGEGVREVGQHKMGFYEFTVPVLDGVMYNGIFFIELDGKGVFFGLNCMERHQEKWQPIAHGIMNTLQIVDEKAEQEV